MNAYVVRDNAGPLRLSIDPTIRSDWSYTGLYLVDLGEGETRTLTLDRQEALILVGFVFVVAGITLYQEHKTERAGHCH